MPELPSGRGSEQRVSSSCRRETIRGSGRSFHVTFLSTACSSHLTTNFFSRPIDHPIDPSEPRRKIAREIATTFRSNFRSDFFIDVAMIAAVIVMTVESPIRAFRKLKTHMPTSSDCDAPMQCADMAYARSCDDSETVRKSCSGFELICTCTALAAVSGRARINSRDF